MNRRIVLRVALAAALTLGVTLAARAADAPLKLNVGLVEADPVHMLHYIVEAKGFAKDEKLEAQWVTFNSGGAAAQGITAGAVDVTEGSIFAVIDAFIAGRDLISFWNTSSLPVYAWYGPAKYHSLQEIKAQKGKIVIGVAGITGIGFSISRWAVQQAGVDSEKDVQWLSIGGPMERAAALRSGQVDLIPSTPPSSFLLADEGYRSVLELKDVMPDFQYETIYARKATLGTKVPEIRALLRAIVRAKIWATANPEAATDILMKNLGAKSEDKPAYLRTVALMLPYFPADGAFARKSIDVFLQFKKDDGKIKDIPSQAGFTDDRFIDYFKEHPVTAH